MGFLNRRSSTMGSTAPTMPETSRATTKRTMSSRLPSRSKSKTATSEKGYPTHPSVRPKNVHLNPASLSHSPSSGLPKPSRILTDTQPDDLSGTYFTNESHRWGDPDATLQGFFENENLGGKVLKAAKSISQMPNKEGFSPELQKALTSLKGSVQWMSPGHYLQSTGGNNTMSLDEQYQRRKINKTAMSCAARDTFRKVCAVSSQLRKSDLEITTAPGWDTDPVKMQSRQNYRYFIGEYDDAARNLHHVMESLGTNTFVRKTTDPWALKLAETQASRLAEFDEIRSSMRHLNMNVLASGYAKSDTARWHDTNTLNDLLTQVHPLDLLNRSDPVYSDCGLSYTVNGQKFEKTPERLLYEGLSGVVKRMNNTVWTTTRNADEKRTYKSVAPVLKELHSQTSRLDSLLSQLVEPPPPESDSTAPPPKSWKEWMLETTFGPPNTGPTTAPKMRDEMLEFIEKGRELRLKNDLARAKKAGGQDDECEESIQKYYDEKAAKQRDDTMREGLRKFTESYYPGLQPPTTTAGTSSHSHSQYFPSNDLNNSANTDSHWTGPAAPYNNSPTQYTSDTGTFYPTSATAHPPQWSPHYQSTVNPSPYTGQSIQPPTYDQSSAPPAVYPPQVTHGYATTAFDDTTAAGTITGVGEVRSCYAESQKGKWWNKFSARG